MTRRYWLLLTLTIFLALALAACGAKGDKTSPTEEAAAPAAQATAPKTAAKTEPTAAPQKKAAAEPTAEPAEAPAATPEDEPLSLASRDTGLDALTSYRLTWHAEWKSTDQGKEEQGAWDWTEEYTSDPKAHHLTMSTPDSSDPGNTGAFEMWQIGDTSYMKSGEDDECISFSTEGAEKDIQKGSFNPSMLGSIEDAKYVGRETINGIPTKHYKYNSKTGMLAALGEVSGETWVASDGGYVVKDTVKWTGGGGLLGLGASTTATGDGSWTWELSDVNKPIEIKPPEGCEGSKIELPIMPDASEKSRFGDMTTYKSAGKPADVATFYKEELAAAGWKPEGEPTEMGDVVMLNFAKDDQKLSVMITASDGATQVILTVSK
jgi:predicted small lipoprotein YifL